MSWSCIKITLLKKRYRILISNDNTNRRGKPKEWASKQKYFYDAHYKCSFICLAYVNIYCFYALLLLMKKEMRKLRCYTYLKVQSLR